MLAVTFIVSCLSVCGFYVYVLVRLEREHRMLKDPKKRMPEHLFDMGSEPDGNGARGSEIPGRLSSRGAAMPPPRPEPKWRHETMIQVGLTVGGLAALFAGIEVINSMVTWLHWN